MKKFTKLLVTVIFCFAVAAGAVLPAFAAVAGVKGLKATVTYNSVTLSWKKASGVSGYEVQQYTAKKWKTVAKTSKTKYTIKKLKTGTSYKFRVRAYKGKSYGKAAQISAKPVCVAPTKLKASKVSSTALKLSWKKVSGATAYNVQKFNGKKWVTVAKNVKKTSATVSGLTPTVNTKFRVYAYSKVGKKVYNGAYSKTLTAKTTIIAPSSVAFSTADSSSVTLTWGKVAGATSYAVYSYSGSKYTFVKSSNTNSVKLTGLKANTAYKYAVKTCIKVGSKNYYSSYSSAIAAKTAPAAVSGLSLSELTDSGVNLSWKASTGATGYEVWILKSGKWSRLPLTKNASCSVSGLNSLTAYSFKVRAYASYGKKTLYSTYSSEVKATTLIPAVEGFKADNVTESAISLSWNEEARADVYRLERSSDNVNWTSLDLKPSELSKSGSTLKYDITGLSASTIVYFKLSAVKDGVPGASTALTGKTVPAAVTGLKAVAGDNGSSVDISWDASSASSDYIDGYIVRCNRKDGAVDVKTNFCNFGGLEYDTEYGFSVEPYVVVSGKSYSGKESDLVSATTYLEPVGGFKVDKNGTSTLRYYTAKWNDIPDMVYTVEYYNSGDEKWETAGECASGEGATTIFRLKSFTSTVSSIACKSTTSYLTNVTWDAVPGATEYAVKTSIASTTDKSYEQLRTTSTSATLRLPPQTKMTVTVEAYGAYCRIKGVDINSGKRTGYSYFSVATDNATASSGADFTTANAPAFSSSNNESKLLYTLKLVQAINNTKYAQGTVKASRSSVISSDLKEAKYGSLDLSGLMKLLPKEDREDLEQTMAAGSNENASGTFTNGKGTYVKNSKDPDTGATKTETVKNANLYNFVTPEQSSCAYFYGQNDNISTFSNKVKSVSVNGNTITVVLKSEQFSNNTSSIKVHGGFMNSGEGSFSGDDSGFDFTYKVGKGLKNVGKLVKKWAEDEKGTTITAVLTNDNKIKTLKISSPYIIKMAGSYDGTAVSVNMDGVSTLNYSFTY